MPPLRKAWGALAATAVVVAVFAQGAAAVPTPKADYRFHNNHDSSVPGPPPIGDIGSGNTFATESEAGCATRVLTFPQGNGLLADTAGVIPAHPEAVVMDLRLADVSGFRRLIGTSDVSSDSGLYVHDGKLDWYQSGDHEGSSATVPANSYVEVALLQIPILSQFTDLGYVNGVEQFHFTTPDSTETGTQPRLFKDNDPDTTGEESAGAVSRISFYGQPVTPMDIGDIYNASVLGNPSSCPAASASATGKPRTAKGPGGSVLIDTGIQGNCPDSGVDCNGTASVAGAGAKKSKASVLGSASFSVPAGKSQEVVFGLGKRGRKLLRKKGKLKVTASVSSTGPNGKPVTVQTRGKIRYPKKRR